MRVLRTCVERLAQDARLVFPRVCTVQRNRALAVNRRGRLHCPREVDARDAREHDGDAEARPDLCEARSEGAERARRDSVRGVERDERAASETGGLRGVDVARRERAEPAQRCQIGVVGRCVGARIRFRAPNALRQLK